MNVLRNTKSPGKPRVKTRRDTKDCLNLSKDGEMFDKDK